MTGKMEFGEDMLPEKRIGGNPLPVDRSVSGHKI
jgi:hypothetical protein